VRMPSVVIRSVLAVTALVALLSAAPPATAQMPGPPKNLQVLPKDISHPELLRIMNGFAAALGVHCDFCHVQPPGPHGPGSPPPDFASDDKENKKKARVMLKMVAAINGEYLPKIAEGEEPPRIACETCHRGAKEPPEPLATKLTATAAAKGVDAAIDQYMDLRSTYAESGLYDFREGTLLRVAHALGDDKRTEQSLAILKRSKSLFPNSADVAASLGMALAQSGDVAGGRAELERALTIDPNNMGARFGIERLNHPLPAQPPPQSPSPPR
jgi:tetratricopeptide (TPR) repeat protein